MDKICIFQKTSFSTKILISFNRFKMQINLRYSTSNSFCYNLLVNIYIFAACIYKPLR